MRRIDRPAGQQHLRARAHLAQRAALGKFHPDRAPSLEQHAMRQCAGLHPQIRPRQRRAQIGHRRAGPPAPAHRDLQRSDAVLLRAVEIGVERNAAFDRTRNERIVQLVVRAQVGHRERTAGAVVVVGAAFLVLGAAEIGQHVVERPAGAAQLPPQVEILLLPADVDQPVDGAGSAQHPPARPGQAPIVEAGDRFGLEHPGELGVEDVTEEPGRDMDPQVAVLPAGFQQQHSRLRVRAQSVGQHAAGRAGADDHVVVFFRGLHRPVSPSIRRRCSARSAPRASPRGG